MSNPLTCKYCRHSPATHLLVADLKVPGRIAHLVCEPCGVWNINFAKEIAKSPTSVWLFSLTEVTTN